MRESISLQQALIEEYRTHRPVRPVDLLKLVYQSEFGCGHLIDDPQQALCRLVREEEELSCEGRKGPDYTPIGSGLARLHLRCVKKTGLSIETVHKMFLLSAREMRGSREGFLKKAECVKGLCRSGYFSFSEEEVAQMVEEWKEAGGKPFSHSELYRRTRHPAYRVVEERFCEFLPLFAAIDRLLQEKERVVLCVDGNCGSGKTTLAHLLQEVYGCGVIHADHFFLQPHQRTEARLSEPGGNLDRERMITEVLRPLRAGKENVSYRPFDCSRGQLGEAVTLPESRIFVVEGSYSNHRDMALFYDLSVFCTVKKAEQLRRIRERSGEELLRRFEEVWIPMENAYFEAHRVRQRSDLVFETD